MCTTVITVVKLGKLYFSLCNAFIDTHVHACMHVCIYYPTGDSWSSRSWCPHLLQNSFGSRGSVIYGCLQALMFVTVVGYLLALTIYYFFIEVDVETWTISSQIRMSVG